MKKIIKYAIICLYVGLFIFTFCPTIIKLIVVSKSIGVFFIALVFTALALLPLILLVVYKNNKRDIKSILISMVVFCIVWLFFYIFLNPVISKPYCFDIWECVSNGNY